ncbi:MAG TPA: phosphate ABC transporter phosphate-binding protein, partial [Ruminococcaceae bacterium]|nr:phosphate ABC transporter phosphate-binding protein [Oscillospiraceae bacterium]
MKKILAVMCSVLLMATAFAGCGGNGDKDSSTPSATGGSSTAAATVSGKVTTDGSTSMEKVILALGESFKEEHKGITFSYNPTGSGAGITAVGEGRC